MTSIGRAWQRLRNTPGLGRDAIALVVLVVVGIACGVYTFAQYGYHPPGQQRVMFAADFASAPGVRPESRQEVRIAGVSVGKIESAEPRPDGTARLVMSLDPGHPVYSNAHLVLSTKAPLNIMYVELNPGGPPGRPLPPNGVIPVSQTERPIQPTEAFDKLDDRTRGALTALLGESDVALADAPARLPAGLMATDGAVDSFRPVVEQLQTRRETIQKLVTALAEISTAAGGDDARLAGLVSSLQGTLSTLANRDQELGATLAQLPGFTQDLNHAMSSTSALTGQLNPALDALNNAANQLPPALSRLTNTVDSAGRLVGAATPVVAKARPVVADLRPLAGDLGSALGDLAPVTAHLPSATARIVPWLDDLAAFVYQTSSAFSLHDANGGFGRANITIDINNPSGGLGPVLGAGPNGGGK